MQNNFVESPKLDEATSNDDQTNIEETGSISQNSKSNKISEYPSQHDSPIRVKDEAANLRKEDNGII